MASYTRTYMQLPREDLQGYSDPSFPSRVADQVALIFEELDTLQAVNGGTPLYVSAGSFGLATGTQGGIPYFSSSTSLSSSTLLGRNQVVIGGGSTGSPATLAMPSLASRYALTATTGTAAPIWTLATATATADSLALRHSDGGAAFASLTATTLTATAATFSGVVRADSGLFVAGGATISGTLNAGAATFSGVVTAGAATFTSIDMTTLTATHATFSGTARIGGGLTVAGASTMAAVGMTTLTATAATFTGTVHGAGATFSAVNCTTLTATAATFTGAVNAQAATFTSVNMTTLTATHATFSGVVRADGGLTAGGASTLAAIGATTITATHATFSGVVRAEGLTVATATTLAAVSSTTLTATAATFSGAINAQGATFAAVQMATLTATAATFSGTIHGTGATFSAVNCTTLTATAATFTGGVRTGAGLFVTGGMTVSGTLNAGAATFTDTVNASMGANIFGAASLGSTLTVAGGVTVTGVTNLGAATITGALNGADATFSGIVNIPATGGGSPAASKATNNTTTTISGISGTITSGTATLSVVSNAPNFDFNWAGGTTQSFTSGWPMIPFPVALVGGAGKGTLTVANNGGPPTMGTQTDLVTVTGSAAAGLSVLGATTLAALDCATLTGTSATFSGTVRIGGGLTVAGASTMAAVGMATLTATAATFSGALNAAGATFTGVVRANGGLTAGATTLTGGLSGTTGAFSGQVDVTGGSHIVQGTGTTAGGYLRQYYDVNGNYWEIDNDSADWVVKQGTTVQLRMSSGTLSATGGLSGTTGAFSSTVLMQTVLHLGKNPAGTIVNTGDLGIFAPAAGTAIWARLNQTQANINASNVWQSFESLTGTEGTVAGTAVAGVIAYNTFTGSHWSQSTSIDKHVRTIKDKDTKKERTIYDNALEPGTVLVSTAEMCEWPSETNLTLPKCAVSTKKYDKAIYGVYGGHDKDGDILVLAVGSGLTLVTDEGGPIEIGDWLCTSSTPGHAMKCPKDLIAECGGFKARQEHKTGNGKIACSLLTG